MITTTYTCDKCGHQQDTGTQMWYIGITITHHNTPAQASPHKDLHKLWCRTCVEDVGLLPFSTRPKTNSTISIPSIEDMIRQIAQEAIDAARHEH